MTQATQSALEWFYQSGAAESNLPVEGVTYELGKVRDDCLHLATLGIFERIANLDNRNAMRTSAQALHRAALELGVSRSSQEGLVSSIAHYVETLRSTGASALLDPQMKSAIKSVIINLVMLAKLSRDVGIRQQIIDLAETCASVFARPEGREAELTNDLAAAG